MASQKMINGNLLFMGYFFYSYGKVSEKKGNLLWDQFLSDFNFYSRGFLRFLKFNDEWHTFRLLFRHAIQG